MNITFYYTCDDNSRMQSTATSKEQFNTMTNVLQNAQRDGYIKEYSTYSWPKTSLTKRILNKILFG